MINKSEIKNIYSKTKEKGYIIAQNLMYLYIILCPIFDMASYIYRNYIVKQESISVNPITLLRPIIPMIILMIIFFKVSLAEKIYNELEEENIDVMLDDRDEKPGFKFKDADLIGFPFKVVVGKRADEGIVELKIRRTGETLEVSQNEVIAKIKELMKIY